MYARYEVGLNSLTCSDGQRIQRARRCQPTWRTFRQWKTAARVHTQEDRGALAQRRASVRHQSAAARLARLREQDTWQVRDCSVVKHKKLLKSTTSTSSFHACIQRHDACQFTRAFSLASQAISWCMGDRGNESPLQCLSTISYHHAVLDRPLAADQCDQ